MASTLRVSVEDWTSDAFRTVTLKEARKQARSSRTRVLIQAGDSKHGYRTMAVIDGRFYVGRVTTLRRLIKVGILLLTGCSGGSFDKVQATVAVDTTEDSGTTMVDSGLPTVSLDANMVPHDTGSESSPTSNEAGKTDSGTTPELTCPDVTHCDGKAWTGKTCGQLYSVCCLDNGLCGCCVG